MNGMKMSDKLLFISDLHYFGQEDNFGIRYKGTLKYDASILRRRCLQNAYIILQYKQEVLIWFAYKGSW